MSINNPANPLKKVFTGNIDFSNASSVKVHMLTLLADGWDEENIQEVSVSDILEDINKQLIIPMPAEDSENSCKTFGVKPFNQSAGHLSFVAETTPDVDVEIVVFIFEAVSVEDNTPEENYVWWSPEMTSDTAPSPYVASASSVYLNYYAYKAFDGISANAPISNSSYWNATYDPNAYIQLDFGSKVKIFGIRMYGVNISTDPVYTVLPKDFTVYGSVNGESWKIVYDYVAPEDTPAINPGEMKEYMFDSVHVLRQIKIVCKNNYGVSQYSNCYAIGEIQFYRPESEVTV